MQEFTRRFFALGSDCAVHIHADDEGEAIAAIAAAIAEVGRIEARYSRYRADSLLSSINAVARAGGGIDVDPETAGLIGYAFTCHRLSGGLFDITSGLLRQAWDFSSHRLPDDDVIAVLLPRIGLDKVEWKSPRLTFRRAGMEIDFGGIGKEYAVDRATGVCRAMGARHGLVDLGGDIGLIGPRPDGAPWSIGIRHPRQPTTPVTAVSLAAGALATSGDYERFMEINGRRYCHILDPRSGWPARGLSSVSVMTDTCLTAGSLATIAMLKGAAGAAWLKSLGVRFVIVDEHGRLEGSGADFGTTP